jgi:hypothetical protein
MRKTPTNTPSPPRGRARPGFAPFAAPGAGIGRSSPRPAAAACAPAASVPVKGRDGEWRVVRRGGAER